MMSACVHLPSAIQISSGLRLWCAVAALGLMGCGALGERVAGWYVTRELDSYLAFSSEQKRVARTRVDEAIDVLKARELPAWVSLLREMRQGIHDGLTEEAIARLQRRHDERLDAAVTLLSPYLASMLAELSEAQLDHFAQRLREEVDEHYEERLLPEPERRAAIEKRGLKTVEDLVGDLNDAQEIAVRGILARLPDERPAQYRSALKHITQLRAFLSQRPPAASIAAELRAMWEHRFDALGKGRDKTSRRAWQRKALWQIARLLDAEQRAHAEETLSERIRKLKRFGQAQ